MEYPKQLITSLCDQLNQPLIDFFNIEKRKNFSTYEDINSLVSATLWEFVRDSTAKADLSAVYSRQVKNRHQKRHRWYKAFQDGLNESIDNKKHPLNFVKRNYDEMDVRSFIRLYEVDTVEKAVEKYQERLEAWQADDKGLLINYPLIAMKTRNQILESYKIDLIINLISIVMNSYDGNLGSYFSTKPELLIDNPVFAPDKFSVPLQATLDSYVANLVDFDREKTVFQMFIPQGQDTAMEKARVFDQRDSQILMALVNNITVDFYESRQVMVEVGAIARSINSKPNKHLYEDVKERLHNMALVNFRICNKDNPNKPIYTFSFIDDVLTQKSADNKEYVVVTFGHALYESISMKQMISVTSSNYNSLELNMSKLLYHNLQKERIILSTGGQPDENGYLYKAYDYSYFQRAVLFKRKRKADIIQLIKTSLDEFVAKGIALAKYDYDSDHSQFHLYYFPLSGDEKADLLKINEPVEPMIEDGSAFDTE